MGSYPRTSPYALTAAHSRRNPSSDLSSDMRSHNAMAGLMSPPLPHQAQAHFYAAPDPNLVLRRSSRPGGIRPGDRGYYVGFDSIQHTQSDATDNVVLVGSEGALDVYKLERIKLFKLGCLEGLRGAVIGATILPTWQRHDPHAARRPLVAAIIHGPVLANVATNPQGDTMPAEMRPTSPLDADPIMYQTTVEIYSLRSHEHVATVFESKAVPCHDFATEPYFLPPPPIGDLRITASSHFLVVCSGISGELYVFDTQFDGPDPKQKAPFRCLGKYWTAIQKPILKERPTSAKVEDFDSKSAVARRQPLYSLCGRWLALVPPASSSSQATINGSISSSQGKERIPGMNQFTPAGTPLVDCVVERPGDEGMLNRMARGLTQEMIKGAQWMGSQGMSAWKNYWSKQNQSGEGAPAPTPPWFPPTHGEHVDAETSHSRKALVSIIDLQRLLDQSAASAKLSEPVATFEAPGGCSFVSISPNGLHLLTVSHGGDEQFVWDLMKLKPTKSREFDQAKSHSNHASRAALPVVRQVAKFQRYTEAQVVDVTWSEPRGDKLAIITHRGTIHLFEMPQHAFQWPPRTLPRTVPSTEPSKPAAPSTNSPATAPQGAFPHAISTLNGSTTPFLDTFRKHSNAGLSALTNNLNIAPARGRKAVTLGVQKSLGAAAEGLVQLRHLGENRLRLSPGSSAVAPGLVRMLSGSARGFVGAISGDALRIHTLPRLDRSKSVKSPGRATAAAKDFEFELPFIPDDRIAPAAKAALVSGRGDNAVNPTPTGTWSMPVDRKLVANDSASESSDPAHALSFAEIDTTSPFQPFHTDRRVILSVYTSRPGPSKKPWAFGQDIPAVVVHAPGSGGPSAAASMPNLLDGDERAMGDLDDEDLLAAEQQMQMHGAAEDEFDFLEEL